LCDDSAVCVIFVIIVVYLDVCLNKKYGENKYHDGTANPTWGDIFESSKLKARRPLLPRFSEKRLSSFELSRAQPALERSEWDARASGPVMVLGVTKAHVNKIRANGHRTPSSDCSSPNAPRRGPSRTRSHFHYTL